MFTGIIEEKGTVRRLTGGGVLELEAGRVLEGTAVGDSISVSGVCLTVVDLRQDGFSVDVMPETLRRSTLGALVPGSKVNLERALGAGGRMGGHIVNGHIEGVGTVIGRRAESNAVLLEISAPEGTGRYVVPKGSVAIDGISLTVADAGGDDFVVSVVPHTLEETTLVDARPGTRVNMEVDIIAKYVESFLARTSGRRGLDEALLDGGFAEPGRL